MHTIKAVMLAALRTIRQSLRQGLRYAGQREEDTHFRVAHLTGTAIGQQACSLLIRKNEMLFLQEIGSLLNGSNGFSSLRLVAGDKMLHTG